MTTFAKRSDDRPGWPGASTHETRARVAHLVKFLDLRRADGQKARLPRFI